MAETSGGANRIELESQILCASLRQSWAINDVKGVLTVVRQLYQLFPDLLPPPRTDGEKNATSLYPLLGLSCDVSQTAVLSGYLRSVRNFLRQSSAKERREDYYRLLDAGYILRKPRLRLSHDLVAVRTWLIEQKAIGEDGSLEAEVVPSLVTAQEAVPKPQAITVPLEEKLPLLIDMLKACRVIGPAEVQALKNQMAIAPEIPLKELVLSAGYVTDTQMQSLQVGEYLLSSGQISMHQLAVAMYDELTGMCKMAESLQVRGWLKTQSFS
jgi:hypothetical protein